MNTTLTRARGLRWRVLLGFAISALCVVLVARQIDVSVLARAFADTHFGLVLAAICALAIGYAVRVVRWSFLLAAAGVRVKPRHAAAPFLASIALNNVLPLRAGDVMRAVVFPSAVGAPRTAAIASMLIERALDVGALAVMAAAGLALSESIVVPPTARGWLSVLAGSVPIAFILAAHVAPRIEGLLRLRVGRWWQALAVAARDLGQMTGLKPQGLAIGLSAAVWTFEAALFFLVLRAVGIEATVAEAFALCGIVTFVTIIPSSPGYVGTFHAAAYAGAVALGGSGAQAAAFSVISHLALWLPTTIAGSVALLLAPGLLVGYRTQRHHSD